VRRSQRSISTPILLAIPAISLCVAMLIAWIFVLLRNRDVMASQVSQHGWLMFAGIMSFVSVIAVLVLFSIFLVREILLGRRQTTFIDSVTHELKSPLASLRLCLETLDRPDVSDDQRHELRRMMLDDVDRLSAFIEDILAVSRIDAPRKETQQSLAEAVAQAARAVAEKHRAPLSRFILEVPLTLTLRADETALALVLKNLLDNALKYSHEPVVVRAHGERNTVRVDVIDRGIGIPRSQQQRIFERFYRVPSEAVNARRGTGLGLFLVAALVRGMGGKLAAVSAGDGRGTTMVVRLPLAEAT
jgi:signal transduction histidine kinase